MSHATAGKPHTHLSIFSVPPGKQVPGLWGTNDLFKPTTCRQNMMQESHCLSKTYKNSKEIKTRGKNAPNDTSRGSLSNVQDSATLLSLARFRTTKALWHCSKVSALSRAFVPENKQVSALWVPSLNPSHRVGGGSWTRENCGTRNPNQEVEAPSRLSWWEHAVTGSWQELDSVILMGPFQPGTFGGSMALPGGLPGSSSMRP